ncbi:hypothetical protein BJX63DRAFT_393522 [Aspergillus granulosus]|uniref:DUF7730 domain-containing protein n=1 Tax=Aspergillus granulosus TaxID=176169 RepID=A0ABR4HEH9_9EURO
MSDISGPWADPEGLKRVKSLTPKNIIELNKLQVKLPSVHRLSHRRRAARLPRVENTVDNRVHPQAQSLFFRLPAELRVVIYQDLLTLLRPLHIWNTENRLASWECTREGPLSFTDGVGLCCKHPDTAFNELLTERRRRSWVLGLLRSCRRM